MAQNIQTLSLSNNGLYLINEERIFFAGENKSYPLEEINIPRWIDILSENSLFSFKNNLLEIQQIMDYHKRVTLRLIEPFDFDDKVGIMLEYEQKFGEVLLSESVDLIEGWVQGAWDWTKNKVIEKSKQFGEFGVKTGKDFMQCITNGHCAPFFEDFREMLFSPVGIAIETFLTVTGIGSIGPMIAWGILLLWDVSLLVSGDPNFSWLNLIFDVLGVGFGAFAKGARTVFGGAKAATESAGKSLTQIIANGMKNPQTASILTKFKGYAEKSLPTIMGWLTQAGSFMSKKLGIKWVGRIIDKVSVSIGKILEAFGVVAKKGTTAQGVASGLKMGAIAQGVVSGSNAIGQRRETELLNTLRTAGPAEYVDGTDF